MKWPMWDTYSDFLVNGYGGGIYYYPLWRYVMYVFLLNEATYLIYGGLLWVAAGFCCRFLCREYPGKIGKLLCVPVLLLTFGFNVDVLILGGIIYLYRRPRANGVLMGMFAGFLSLKVWIIIPYFCLFWLSERKGRFLAGLCVTGALCWGQFLFDNSLFWSWLGGILSQEMSTDEFARSVYWLYWSWAFYPWMWHSHLQFRLYHRRDVTVVTPICNSNPAKYRLFRLRLLLHQKRE